MRSVNLVITKSRGSIERPVRGIIMHTMDGLPWKQEGLRRWFDDLTEGGIVIMSNTTMKNAGEPFPGRKNIVIRMKDLKGAETIVFPHFGNGCKEHGRGHEHCKLAYENKRQHHHHR